MLSIKHGCWGLSVTGTSKLVIFLLGQVEWPEDVDCMGEWMIWMIRKHNCRIEEMNGGDGSTEAISCGKSGVNKGYWISSG